MIYVLTVHWHSVRWIDVQLSYLRRNLAAPYRVHASLNGIDDRAQWAKFDAAQDMTGTHTQKLNQLAGDVAVQGETSDVLVFLDGDAFPVRPLVPWLVEVLDRYPLVAIRRDENLGDRQPHPSFCATTIGFWKEISGDWGGHPWVNAAGREVNDAGGKLLQALTTRQIEWKALLRTNTYNPHPLWFGIYDHRIYHHGGGFQAVKAERVDWSDRYAKHDSIGRQLKPTADSPSLGTLRSHVHHEPGAWRRLRPRHVAVLSKAAVKTLRLRREHHYYERQLRSSQGRYLAQLSDELFRRLSVDPEFYRELDATVD